MVNQNAIFKETGLYLQRHTTKYTFGLWQSYYCFQDSPNSWIGSTHQHWNHNTNATLDVCTYCRFPKAINNHLVSYSFFECVVRKENNFDRKQLSKWVWHTWSLNLGHEWQALAFTRSVRIKLICIRLVVDDTIWVDLLTWSCFNVIVPNCFRARLLRSQYVCVVHVQAVGFKLNKVFTHVVII